MTEFLSHVDPELLLALLSALGVVLTAVFIWVARAVVRYLTGLLNIKLDQSAWMRVDWVARQAALATEQAFKRALVPTQDPVQRAAEKKAHALLTARSLLPPAVSAVVRDEQLDVAIEAAVASIPPPAPDGTTAVRSLTSMLPPVPPPPALPRP